MLLNGINHKRFPMCHLSRHINFMEVQLTVAGLTLSRPLLGIQMPQCTNASSASSFHSGKCHWHPMWHNLPVHIACQGNLDCVWVAYSLWFCFLNIQFELKLLSVLDLNNYRLVMARQGKVNRVVIISLFCRQSSSNVPSNKGVNFTK